MYVHYIYASKIKERDLTAILGLDLLLFMHFKKGLKGDMV